MGSSGSFGCTGDACGGGGAGRSDFLLRSTREPPREKLFWSLSDSGGSMQTIELTEKP